MNLVASVLIPALEEEADIAECLRHVATQDVGAAALEVIVADACSHDRTVEVASAAAAELGFGRFVIVTNPQRRTAAGLNAALLAATTPIVVRVDARSRIPRDYVTRTRAVLADRPEVGVVGGAQVPVDRGGGPIAAGIARALSNGVTTGFSRYRRASSSGPSDTVWMGVFRADELRSLGGWNEAIALNEDFELNERYRSNGQQVWFDAALRSRYVPRPDLRALAQQYFRFGRVKGTWWARGRRVSARHAALVLAPPALGIAVLAGARRHPVATAVIVAAGTGSVDHVGNRGKPATPAIRCAAVAATATFATSWWVGVVAGWAGEQLGVAHRHG